MHHPATSAHAAHDTALIAGHAAGDLDHTQARAASALLATCSHCALLHRDLVAISAAARALPRDARAPRDYRLTAEQAASLRRGSWLRALLRPFAAAHAARPLAAAFTSLGLAGLLVGAFVPGLLGGMAAGPTLTERDDTPAFGAAAPTMAPGEDSIDPLAGAPVGPGAGQVTGNADVSTTDPPLGAQAGGGTESDPKGEGGRVTGQEDLAQAPTQPSLLVVASLAFLLLGLALFGLRLAARRVR